MASKPLVYIALAVPEDALARIEEGCAAVRFAGRGLPSREELLAALPDAEGVLSSAMMQIDAGVLASAPRLRVVSNVGVGFDNVDLAVATQRGVAVCNTPGVLTGAVADLTMALVLSLARRLSEAEHFVRDGQWRPGSAMPLGIDVAGKTLGIVGFGRIGRDVARRAQAFGMSACFFDLFDAAGDDATFCIYRSLDDLLREADFVSIHLNMTPETRSFIGARELSLMKPEAYLINTSRGQVVDQAALVEALRAGSIAGAALDVFEREPLPPDEPLLRLPNVIALPHIGSATRETRRAMLDLAIDNLLAALRGETPACVVNPEALAIGRAGA